MQHYADKTYGANVVGLDLSQSTIDDRSLTQRQRLGMRTIPNQEWEAKEVELKDGLHHFVERYAPQFDGTRGKVKTYREIRAMELGYDELIRHTVDVILTHYCSANKLKKIITALDKLNLEGHITN